MRTMSEDGVQTVRSVGNAERNAGFLYMSVDVRAAGRVLGLCGDASCSKSPIILGQPEGVARRTAEYITARCYCYATLKLDITYNYIHSLLMGIASCDHGRVAPLRLVLGTVLHPSIRLLPPHVSLLPQLHVYKRHDDLVHVLCAHVALVNLEGGDQVLAALPVMRGRVRPCDRSEASFLP